MSFDEIVLCAKVKTEEAGLRSEVFRTFPIIIHRTFSTFQDKGSVLVNLCKFSIVIFVNKTSLTAKTTSCLQYVQSLVRSLRKFLPTRTSSKLLILSLHKSTKAELDTSSSTVKL